VDTVYKAAGPNSLPNWLLQDFVPYLCQPLAAIFNASIRHGYVPPVWKSAEVIPVPKSLVLELCRLICDEFLCCLLWQVFESIVGQWLLSALETSLDPQPVWVLTT